jgi:hypothetical protein
MDEDLEHEVKYRERQAEILSFYIAYGKEPPLRADPDLVLMAVSHVIAALDDPSVPRPHIPALLRWCADPDTPVEAAAMVFMAVRSRDGVPAMDGFDAALARLHPVLP